MYNHIPNPLSLFRQLFSLIVLLILGASFFTGSVLFGQSASDQRREAFYENLEARARSLSQKLAEISGTEPIPFKRPQRSVLSTIETTPAVQSVPQNAYDSLPGPMSEQEKIRPVGGNETLYRADGTPVILQNAPTTSPAITSKAPKKRAISRNMEKERGSYFIQPFIGIAMAPSDLAYKGITREGSISTEVGHILGASFGKRWDNLEGEIHFGYVNSNYGEVNFPGAPSATPADGQLEVFQIGTRLGYGIPFGEGGWFRVAGGFGFASRRDVLNLDSSDSYISSETAFTYDLLLGLGYEVGLGLDAFLAYRLLGVSENGNFDSVALHLFQLGLGANF